MKTMRAFGLAVAVAAVLALAAARPSNAQSAADVDAARDLFIQGSELAQKGDWAAARDRYERSLKLKRSAITLYSLGVAQKNTGLFVEALESLRAFLNEPSTAKTKPYEASAKSTADDLEKRIARVRIEIAPAGAPELAVSIDGQRVPPEALDVARVVNPGEHRVAAIARGYLEGTATVTVAEGASTVAHVDLSPAPIAPPTPSAVPSATLAPVASSAPVAPDRPPPSKTVPYAFIGAGAAVFATGIVIGAIGIKQASDAPTNDGPEADSARVKLHVGDAIGAVGVAGIGVGVVLLLTRGSSKQVTATASGVRVAF